MYVVQPAHPFGPALAALVEQYLDDLRGRGLSPASLDRSYGFVLHRIFLPWCDAANVHEPAQLDDAVLRRFTAQLIDRPTAKGTPLSRHSTRSYVRVVRLFLGWAERQGEEISAKPQLPRAGKRRRDALSREEIETLEAQADSERDRLIIRLLGDCGLRRSEVTNLRTDDVVRTNNRVFLRVHGKGDRDRRVPVPPPLVRRLRSFLQARPQAVATNRVFLASRRGPNGDFEALTDTGVSQLVGAVAARARLGKPVHAHLFRHSWMTEMLRRGMNPIQLSVIAGASQQVIAEHYEHLTEEDAHDAMLAALSRRRPGANG
jgi:integrase